MVSVVARPSRTKQRLEQTRDWLLRMRAAEKLFILSMCAVYVMHSIWLARTVMWFLVLPVMLITVAPYRNVVPVLKSGVFVAAAGFLVLILGTSLLGGDTPATDAGEEPALHGGGAHLRDDHRGSGARRTVISCGCCSWCWRRWRR